MQKKRAQTKCGTFFLRDSIFTFHWSCSSGSFSFAEINCYSYNCNPSYKYKYKIYCGLSILRIAHSQIIVCFVVFFKKKENV